MSRSCAKPTVPDLSALHINTIKTYNTTGFTSSAIGREPLHNHIRPIAYTDRCVSWPLTANYCVPEKCFSAPGTASSHAPSGCNASALLPSPQGHASGAKPGAVSVVGPGSSSRLDRQFFRRLPHRAFLDDPERIKIDLLPSCYTTHRALFTDPDVFSVSGRGSGSRCPTLC